MVGVVIVTSVLVVNLCNLIQLVLAARLRVGYQSRDNIARVILQAGYQITDRKDIRLILINVNSLAGASGKSISACHFLPTPEVLAASIIRATSVEPIL